MPRGVYVTFTDLTGAPATGARQVDGRRRPESGRCWPHRSRRRFVWRFPRVPPNLEAEDIRRSVQKIVRSTGFEVMVSREPSNRDMRAPLLLVFSEPDI